MRKDMRQFPVEKQYNLLTRDDVIGRRDTFNWRKIALLSYNDVTNMYI